MTPEQLRARVLELAEREADPRVIAAMLLRELGVSGLRAAAELSFPAWVANQVKRPHTVRGMQPVLGSDGLARESPKRLEVVDWYARYLGASVRVKAGWKSLGDCSADDLRELAADRQRLAEHLLARAAKFEKLAQAMRDAGVNRLVELDASIAESIVRT